MNKLYGKIEEIEVSGHLSLVAVSMGGGQVLRAIVIETPETAPYLARGGPIAVLFKETEVVLCLGDGLATSLENRLAVQVESLDEGRLLSRLALHCEAGPIQAVVESRGARRLGLKPGAAAFALIASSEIMLAEA